MNNKNIKPKEFIIEIMDYMIRAGLTDYTGGNMALRVGEKIYSTPSGASVYKRWKMDLQDIIVTDIDTHIGDAEDALALVSSIAAVAKAPVIASGIVRSLDDISRLKFVHNVSGAIIGRALFQKDVNLGEALAVANAVTGPTPDFI